MGSSTSSSELSSSTIRGGWAELDGYRCRLRSSPSDDDALSSEAESSSELLSRLSGGGLFLLCGEETGLPADFVKLTPLRDDSVGASTSASSDSESLVSSICAI